MKSITAISSMFILGTTFGLLINKWLVPQNIDFDLTGEDYHLYL
ncbi:hypothetical protein ACSX1A_08340 [Pontibacter sp. MBLB2868]